MMMYAIRTLIATAAFAGLIGMVGASTAPLRAQDADDVVPVYTQWVPAWDQYQFDKRHVRLGVVTGFSPYRLTIATREGDVMTVDLKNGTIIEPTGATPTQGERVAIIGYWSNGTFIANRVVLRA